MRRTASFPLLSGKASGILHIVHTRIFSLLGGIACRPALGGKVLGSHKDMNDLKESIQRRKKEILMLEDAAKRRYTIKVRVFCSSIYIYLHLR